MAILSVFIGIIAGLIGIYVMETYETDYVKTLFTTIVVTVVLSTVINALI